MSEDEIEKRKKTISKFVRERLFFWIEDNYDKIFLGILIVAFIIRFIIFLKTFDQAIWWDTGDYLATAKRWAGFNSNMIDMWYYRRGFFWPAFCSIFFRFGLGEIGIRFALVLISTGGVLISYFLIKDMFGKKLALLTSIALTASWIYLFFTGRPLTNLPAASFLLVSLFFFWKGYVLKKSNKYIYLFGIFFAITCLIRMQYLYFLIPLLIFLFVHSKFNFLKNKHLWIAAGIFLICFVPWGIMAWQHFGNPILDLANYYLGIKGISQTGEVGGLGSFSTLSVYFTNLPYILDGNQKGYSTLLTLSPIYILFLIGLFLFFGKVIIGIDKTFKSLEIQKRLFVLIMILSSFLFMGYIAPHLEQRYIMEVTPFLFLIAVYPLKKLSSFLERKFKISSKKSLVIILIILILALIPNILFGFSLTDFKKTSYLEVKLAGEWIKDNSNVTDKIISASLPQIAYYSERSTYPFNLAYRRDLPRKNESDLEEFIRTEKPRYFMVSIFENQPDWTFNFPQNHSNWMYPVQAYYQQDQPVLIIYEFNYSNLDF